MASESSSLLILILGAAGVLVVWNMAWRFAVQRQFARAQAEALALQQFMLARNRELQKIMEDQASPLADRWARAKALLAAVSARNPTSDPGINAWIDDNRAYLAEQIGRRPEGLVRNAGLRAA
jgi:hypothetical protein